MTNHAKRKKRKRNDPTTFTFVKNNPMQNKFVKQTMKTAYSSCAAMLSTNAKWKLLKKRPKRPSKYRKNRKLKKKRKIKMLMLIMRMSKN